MNVSLYAIKLAGIMLRHTRTSCSAVYMHTFISLERAVDGHPRFGELARFRAYRCRASCVPTRTLYLRVTEAKCEATATSARRTIGVPPSPARNLPCGHHLGHQTLATLARVEDSPFDQRQRQSRRKLNDTVQSQSRFRRELSQMRGDLRCPKTPRCTYSSRAQARWINGARLGLEDLTAAPKCASVRLVWAEKHRVTMGAFGSANLACHCERNARY